MQNKKYTDDLFSYIPSLSASNALSQVVNFNQKASIVTTKSNRKWTFDEQLVNIIKNSEMKTILPSHYIDQIELPEEGKASKESCRLYDTSYKLSIAKLSRILNYSFGAEKTNGHRRYASGGGLFPVLPLLVLLNESSIEGLDRMGVYYFDVFDNNLKLIKEFDNKEISELHETLMCSDFISNVFIAYGLNLRLVIAKYGELGYKNSLIEVGAMCQAFRESLGEVDPKLSDLSYASIQNNRLARILGVNGRTCPVAIIQWFGRKKEL